MKKILLLIALRIIAAGDSSCVAQQVNAMPLQKGQSLPPMTLQVWKGDSSYSVSLNAYRGKLILLDFWGSFCSNCLAALPGLLKMQQQFPDQLQVLVVTPESHEQTRRSIARFHKGQEMAPWAKAARQLAFVAGDSIFSRLFPYKVLPTHVWINPDLTYRAITYPGTTTAANVQALLNNQPVTLDEQTLLTLEDQDPVSWLSTSPSAATTYCFVTPYRETGQRGVPYTKFYADAVSGQLTGVGCLNLPLLELYRLAYSYWQPDPARASFPDNRIWVNVERAERFFRPPSTVRSGDEWIKENAFCFAFKCAAGDSASFYRRWQDYLDLFFGLRSEIAIQKVTCWVLSSSGLNAVVSKGGASLFVSDHGRTRIRNMEMQQIINNLIDVVPVAERKKIFLNETGYNGPVDIDLPWDRKSTGISQQETDAALQQYGLKLSQEDRFLPMLVIRDAVKNE